MKSKISIEILSFCVGIVIGVFLIVPNFNVEKSHLSKKDSSAIFLAILKKSESLPKTSN